MLVCMISVQVLACYGKVDKHMVYTVAADVKVKRDAAQDKLRVNSSFPFVTYK